MEVVGGLLLLGGLFLLFGAVEKHDNDTPLGKEVIAGLDGNAKRIQENSGNGMMLGGIIVVVLTILFGISTMGG